MSQGATSRAPDFSALPPEVARKLRHTLYLAAGLAEGLEFVAQVNADRAQIEDRIRVVQDRLNDRNQQGPMRVGLSTRTHQEGYLQGLETAVAIINEAAADNPHNDSAPPSIHRS